MSIFYRKFWQGESWKGGILAAHYYQPACEEPLLKRWMSSRLDYEPISDHMLYNAGSLFIWRREGLFANHYSLCVHYAYFWRKIDGRLLPIDRRTEFCTLSTTSSLFSSLFSWWSMLPSLLSSTFLSSLLCSLLDQHCKDVLQRGLFWSLNRVEERRDKRRHFTFQRFIYTGEKKKVRHVNAFVERGSFKSSPRKLMVNFLILLNAMFGERDAFSADNRFRSALRFTFLFKA